MRVSAHPCGACGSEQKIADWESQIAERELELKRRQRAAEADAARAALHALEEGGD